MRGSRQTARWQLVHLAAQPEHPTSPLQSSSLFLVCESKRRALPKQPLDMQSSITKTQDLFQNYQSLLECDTICFMRNVGTCLPNYVYGATQLHNDRRVNRTSYLQTIYRNC